MEILEIQAVVQDLIQGMLWVVLLPSFKLQHKYLAVPHPNHIGPLSPYEVSQTQRTNARLALSFVQEAVANTEFLRPKRFLQIS